MIHPLSGQFIPFPPSEPIPEDHQVERVRVFAFRSLPPQKARRASYSPRSASYMIHHLQHPLVLGDNDDLPTTERSPPCDVAVSRLLSLDTVCSHVVVFRSVDTSEERTGSGVHCAPLLKERVSFHWGFACANGSQPHSGDIDAQRLFFGAQRSARNRDSSDSSPWRG